MARVIIALMTVVAASSTFAQDPWFDTRIDYGVGGAALSVCVIDLDGNGSKDVATVNYNPHTVSVLMNNGSGALAAAVNYSVEAIPYSIFPADLDGDSDYDLAVTMSNAKVAILRGNGDGTFQSPTLLVIGSGEPWSVIAHDFNGDGDLDLAVTGFGSGSVSILENNGDASFQAAINYGVVPWPLSVCAVDVDDDGDGDLAVASQSGLAAVLKNNGNGTFQSAVTYGVGNDPRSITGCDIDGDGDKDLAVANRGSDNVAVLENSGSGTFSTAVFLSTLAGANSVCAVDLDEDGDDDLAVADYGSASVSIFGNNGDGTFQGAVNFAVGGGPFSIQWGDIDSDGDEDLVVGNESGRSISVLENLAGPSHVPSTIRVPEEQPTIQAGIDAAWPGDTVLVVAGTYTGEGNRDILIFGKSIVLLSEVGQGSTVIDCEGTETARHGGIEVSGCPFPGVLIKGFTVVGASADAGTVQCTETKVTIDSCRLAQNTGMWSMAAYGGDVTLVDVTISNNTRGITCGGGGSLRLSKCAISNNSSSGAIIYGNVMLTVDSCIFAENVGPALVFDYATADITHSVFTHNEVGIRAMHEGSPHFRIANCEFAYNGPTVRGAGIEIWYEPFSGSIQVDSCRFIGNSADQGGAARVYATAAHPRWQIFSNCQFIDNQATEGGAIYFDESYDLTISGCLFANNVAQNGGAVVFNRTWGTEIDSCTFIANASPEGGHLTVLPYAYSQPIEINRCLFVRAESGAAVACQEGGLAPILDCVNIFANAGGDWVGCIADQYGQNGNISIDPLFCDTANGNYSLYDFSPCAAANNSCNQLIGAYDVACSLAATLALPSEPDSVHVVSAMPTINWAFDPAAGWVQSDFEIAVGTDQDWSYAEMWNPAPIASQDQSVIYAGAVLLDGATYFARVRSKLNGSWTPWYETSFRMNSLPSKPVASSPANGATVGSLPSLFVSNATDAEADPLSYRFLLYDDPNAVAPLFVSDFIPQTTDSTGWAVGEYLFEDSIYAWRCVAFDGYEYSDTSNWYFFAVDALPEAPSAPALVSPVGESLILYDMLPSFVWTGAADPDPFDEVRYRLELSLNQNFTLVVPFDNLADTAYHFADSLSFDTRYWWRVKALDPGGLFSTSAPSDFWTWTLGDVNRTHDCTIGDISILIDHLFIAGTPIDPQRAGDVNATCDITIGDVSIMIDHLFIAGASFKPGCE